MNLLNIRFMREVLLPNLAYLIIKILSSSLNIKYINREKVEESIKAGDKIIFAFWHQRQFFLVNPHSGFRLALMTSLSKDGELQTAILSKFGYRCIRGSSSKGGVSALKAMVRIVREGYNVALAVDGPKGPIYEVKDGILFLAKMTKAVIIPVSASSKSFVFKKAWDRYMLPIPFSKAVIIYGEPITISEKDEISVKREEVKRSLDYLTLTADKEAGFMLK